MTDMFAPILSELNPTYVWIFVGICAILVVLSIVKKAIKLALIVGLIGLCVSVVAPWAQDFQEKYKINFDNGALVMKVNGEDFRLDKEAIKSMQLVNDGFGNYSLGITYDDGLQTIGLPTFMTNTIKEFADRYSIPIEVLE